MRSIGGAGGLDLTQDMKPPKTLYVEVSVTRCILVDSSTVTCWTSPFVIQGCVVYFVAFILLVENPVSKQFRP